MIRSADGIIRYGIIGCGMMGREHIQNIRLLENTEITVIYEPDAQMAEAAKRLAPEARMATSIEDLLSQETLDCLVIVSPNFCHVAQLELIEKLRPLPTLVEKPLLTDPSDFATVERWLPHSGFSKNAPVWVAMEYRYMPPIMKLRERMHAVCGDDIRMLTIREHRFPFLQKANDWNRFNRYSGGTFVEKCCHFFDLMRLLLASEVVRVQASTGMAVNHLDERYAGETPDIHDHGYVLCDFENGARAMLELCMFAEGGEYQEEISVVGSRGRIECQIPGPGRFWPSHLGAPPVPRVIESPRDPKSPTSYAVPVDAVALQAGDHNGSTLYQHQRFLQLVKGQLEKPDVSIADGLAAVRIGMQAQGDI